MNTDRIFDNKELFGECADGIVVKEILQYYRQKRKPARNQEIWVLGLTLPLTLSPKTFWTSQIIGELDCSPSHTTFMVYTVSVTTCPLAQCFYFFNVFYFWLRWVFVAARGLSLVVASGGYSSLWCAGFSLRWFLLLRSMGSSHAGSRAQAQQLWRTGFVALRHVGSSWTRARSRVSCIGGRILNHCATKECPLCF